MGENDLADPDVALMLRFQGGDRSAFEELVRRYTPLLVNFMHRYVGQSDVAEDLAQETFLKVLRARSSYAPTARFKTWLFTIATNLCLNQRRNEGHRFHLSINARTGPDPDREIGQSLEDRSAPRPEDSLARGELGAAVRAAISALPPNQRLAVLMSRYEEMPYSEIGRALGISVMAVKSLLNRARQNLREHLAPALASAGLLPEDGGLVDDKGRVSGVIA